MKQLLAILFFALMIPALFAQQGDRRFDPSNREIDPILVPSTPTVVINRTAYVFELTLTNEAAGAGNDATCIIVDGNGRRLYGDTVFGTGQGKGSHFVFPYKGRKMPTSTTWSCTGGSVTGYIAYQQGRY